MDLYKEEARVECHGMYFALFMSMSLLNFGFTQGKKGEDQCPKRSADGPAAEDEIQTKNKKYDTQRKRVFLPQWKTKWPWVAHDEVKGVMFCKTCRKYPSLADKSSPLFSGTSNFRVDPLKSHRRSREHETCELRLQHESKENATTELKNTPIGKALLKVDENQKKRLCFLFNTAYAVAKKGKPFSDFEYICELQIKNGLDLGENYLNDHACQKFVLSAAHIIRDDIKSVVAKNHFVSVLSDGSTDSAVVEQEIVYLRYIDFDFKPITRLIEIVPLENANATGIYSSIQKGLETVNLSFEKLQPTAPGPSLACANFDGCNVMLGHKGGVITKIKEVIPTALGIHCVAHKLELAVLDASKSCPQMAKFEDALKGIFNYYHFSPKRRRELKEISHLFETELAHFSAVKQVRWLASKERAVSALKRNLATVVMHLEHRHTEGTRAEDSNRAKGYHKEITTVTFIKMLYFLLDFLPAIARLSKIFQKEEFLIFEIQDVVERAVIELSALKLHPGTNMKEFQEKLNLGERKFGDIELTGNQENFVSYCDDQTTRNLIDNTIQYINTRFSNLKEEPLSLMTVFDFHKWPLGSQELGTFGNNQIKKLVCEHLDHFFLPEEREEIPAEWILLKLFVRSFRTNPLVDVYSLVLKQKPSEMSHLLKLIEYLLVVSPSTASCERGFSKMNVLKTRYRTGLRQESLQSQLLVMTEGPELEHFDGDRAINHWLTVGPGTRHVSGHALPSSKRVESATCTSLEVNLARK